MEKVSEAAWNPIRSKESGFENPPFLGEFFDSEGKSVNENWQVIYKSSSLFNAALHKASSMLPLSSNHRVIPPHGFDIADSNQNWLSFELDRIFEVLVSDAIRSVSDATIKTTAYLSIINSTTNGNRRYCFRGQSNIGYSLVPRLGRLIAGDIKDGKILPPNHRAVTSRELFDLKEFQSNWPVETVDKIDELTVKDIPDNASQWWFLMQHYADGYGDGTRLLDVTTSLLFALLFACVDWEEGTINEGQDGIVYFFLEGQNARVDDFLQRSPSRAKEFFNTDHDVRYMIFNPPHNERSKAQGGGFIWWPKFWEPQTENLPYLRVPAENKKMIAKELLSFGVGPKEAVRGEKGLQNEKTLIKYLY